MSPAELQAQLDELEMAINSGVLTISARGQSTTYRSLSEMERVRNRLRSELSIVSNGGIAWQKPGYSKGLDTDLGD